MPKPKPSITNSNGEAQAEHIGNLTFRVPAPSAPGYLLRQRRASEFSTALREGNLTPAAWDALVEFFLDYVDEPRDRDAARELIWQASEEDYDRMLGALSGKKAAPPLPSSAN